MNRNVDIVHFRSVAGMIMILFSISFVTSIEASNISASDLNKAVECRSMAFAYGRAIRGYFWN
ncbi:hypothetical protein JW979_05905, partial [bacterium]|nr:hypothetical protein [candidate division CSSED10-310 bacterium]